MRKKITKLRHFSVSKKNQENDESTNIPLENGRLNSNIAGKEKLEVVFECYISKQNKNIWHL